MKKLKLIIMAVLITGLGLNSCSKDDEVTESNTNNPSTVQLKVSVSDYSIAESKSNPVSDNSDSRKAFNNGDKISITADDQSAIIYENSSEIWSPPYATTYLKWNASPMTFKAFYPAEQNDATMTTFTIPVDQSKIASIQSADYMTMTAMITNVNNNVANIALIRRTALINVIISKFGNGLTDDQKKVSNVKIHSAKGDLTTSPSVPKEITPYTTTKGDGIEGSVYSAIVIPAEAIEGETFISLTYGINNEELKKLNIPEAEAGYIYTYSLKIGNDAVSILSITKKEWGTGATLTGGDAVGPHDPFIDDNFEAAVITKMKEINSSLTISSIDVYDSDQLATLEKIDSLDVCHKSITSLKGIEYLTGLTALSCGWNSLTELDVSKNIGLTYLNCAVNSLTELDVSKNTKLTGLYCYGNSLTELDVSKNTELTTLWCERNSLTELDVSKNTGLIELVCHSNSLTELDVSKNIVLTDLYCSSNSLTELDVSKNTGLTALSCDNTSLMTLDVSKNTGLTYLSCNSNSLTELDVSKNIVLTDLYCGNNSLTELDVSKNIVLTDLYCRNNSLTELDVSKNTELIDLWCYSNSLTELDVSKNTGLTILYCADNSLTELDVSKNTELTYLDCSNNSLTTLDVSKNTGLTILYCCENWLSELNFSNALATTDYRLYCGEQTSDGTNSQVLNLTLKANQVDHWYNDLSRSNMNKDITVTP